MHFRINNLQSKIILKVNTYFDYYLLEVYPVTHYMILLNKSTTKRRKIPVYLLFNKSQQKILSSTSQQNTIKYKDLYTITFSRVHVEESDMFFLFTS